MIEFRHDEIGHHGRVYMRRWFVNTPLGSVRLHHIVTSDEPAFHDHPWSFVSLVLRGWYVETHHDGVRTHRRWLSLAFRSARELHYISAVPPGGCWTLVLTGRRRRRWGFAHRLGWLPFPEGADMVYGEWS